MHFSQLVRVACAIAASRSRYHLQLVSPQGVLRSSELVHFSTLLQRHCPGTPNHFHPILLTNDSWCSHAVKGHHCTSTPIDDGAQTLLLMHITSAHHLQLLSHSQLWQLTSARPWLLSFTDELFQTALLELNWRLDNQVISFVVNGSGISAWEAYRPSPSVPAILRSLTVVDLPPSHDQLEALTREPWSRRMNLTGLTLRCGVLEYFQYAMVTQASAGRVTVAGWSADIWDTLRSTLGFRFECVEPLDGLWGATIRKDGRPEGVFGDVASGRVDLGLPYNVLESRHFDYVDALHPVGKTWYVLILRRPSSVDGSANYTQELTWQSWTAAGILFFSSILISKLFFMVSEANRDSTPSSSLMYSVRIFCNMGWGEVEPRRTSFRIWILTLLVVVMVLHVSYSSSLITILTSDRVVLPFHDLQGLHDAGGEYTLGIEKDSFVENLFLKAKSGMLRKVQEDIIAPNPEYVEEISKGMRRVLEQKKHVFFASSQLIEQDCDLTMLPRKYFQQQMVIIIRKKFSAASIINRVLQMMRERGLLQRLALKWHLEGRFRGVSCAGHPASPLGLRETYTAFFMLAAGVGAALSLLMAEIIMNNFEKFRRFLQ